MNCRTTTSLCNLVLLLLAGPDSLWLEMSYLSGILIHFKDCLPHADPEICCLQSFPSISQDNAFLLQCFQIHQQKTNKQKCPVIGKEGNSFFGVCVYSTSQQARTDIARTSAKAHSLREVKSLRNDLPQWFSIYPQYCFRMTAVVGVQGESLFLSVYLLYFQVLFSGRKPNEGY